MERMCQFAEVRLGHWWVRGLSVFLALLAFGCGGGNVALEPTEPIVVAVGPGEFKSATPLEQFSVETITTAVQQAMGSLSVIKPKYAVSTFRLEYLTLDGQGQQVLVSALASVPVKASGASSPVLSYQHGTMNKDADAPTNHVVAGEIAVSMASMGYIVLAPDYVGYGSSKGQLHPYLLAAPSASAVIDLLTAAKYWRQTRGVLDNRQLFLAGYSEGAFVTMAAARAMEAQANPQNQNLVASITGGGPYQVWVTLDELLKKVRTENAVLGALINPGFLRYLSNGVRQSVRDALIAHLLGPDADVAFAPAFIDNFLADDSAAMDRLSNVHDWKTAKPFRLFHGRDDQTVAYLSSSTTLQALQSRGAGSLVSLTDCTAQPSSHSGCVPEFWGFMVSALGALARDL